METSRQHRYVIIGAGMAGILAGVQLLKAGKTNFCIYEKADRIGGTWRENTYPGLTCDVPSHSYTYSFEPNPDWSRHLPPGAEIQAYFENIVEKYQLHTYIKFNQQVTRCDLQDNQWHIETTVGQIDCADFVIAATGVLHHPRYPDIQGIGDFQGNIFHSARWDHSVPLDGKRIAVIGTGSTGVQIISALASRAQQLTHFQRTPQWIMPVINGVFTEAEKAAFRADPALLKKIQNDPELDASIERFSEAITDPESAAMHAIETIVQNNLEQSVTDPRLREKLRPDYRAACKRLIYSEDFYRAVQQPGVEVIVEGVQEIEPKGIRTRDGVLHEFDVIVLATGFKADMFMRPMNVSGRNGVSLNAVWADRPTAYMSISIPDFPNLFMLNGPNGPVGNFSLIEIAEQQWAYIEQLIAQVEQGTCQTICASKKALADFDRRRIAAAKKTIFASGCKSWYLDAQGIPATWPWTRGEFKQAMLHPVLKDFEYQ